jgi:hypothetical protein
LIGSTARLVRCLRLRAAKAGRPADVRGWVPLRRWCHPASTGLDKGIIVNSTAVTSANQDIPRTRAAFRGPRLLVGTYLTISALTLVAIVLLRDTSAVTSAVWVRGTIVVATALLMFAFATRAAGGSSRAFLRLRIASAVMVVAIVVIIAIPGAFPVWLKIEQGVCGVVLVGVVALVNGKRLRSLFATK